MAVDSLKKSQRSIRVGGISALVLTVSLGVAVPAIAAEVPTHSTVRAHFSTSPTPRSVVASLDITSDYQIPDGGVIVTNLKLDGGTILGPGTITVPVGGTLSAPADSSTAISDATLISSTASATAGANSIISLTGGAVFENRGTLSLAAGSDISSDTSSTFVNTASGTVKSGAMSALQTASISSRLRNAGTITWTAGILQITGGDPDGESDTGAISIAKNSSIEVSNVNGSPMVLGSGMTETGPGNFTLLGGYIQVPVAATPPSISSLLLTSGGELDGPGSITVPSTGTLSVKAGDTGYLNGVRVDLKGSFTFRDAYLNLAQGALISDQGTITLGHGASFTTNQSDGQLTIARGGVLTNAGLANSDSVSIDVPLLNQGTVTVASGTLSLTGGTPRDVGGDTGSYTVASGATLQSSAYYGQSMLFGHGLSVTGVGSFQIAGEVGFADGTTSAQVNNLTIANGTLTGPGTLTVNGQLSLSGGTVSGARLIAKAAGSIEPLASFCVRNLGTFELRAALAMGASASICGDATSSVLVSSGASIDLSGLKPSESVQVTPAVTNHGSIKVGRGAISLGTLTNASDGTIAVTETAAATQLLAGTTTLGGTLALTTDPTFDPTAGTVLPLLTASGVSGTFATVTGTLAPPKRYSVVYSPFSVSLRVAAPPTAPTSVVVVPQNGRVKVSWGAPTTGAPVTGYTVTLSPSGATCQTTALSCVVSGLTNGVTYRATVTASNVSGTGLASTAVSVVPATLPQAVKGLTVTQKGTSFVLKWTALAGAATGGRAIVSYTVTVTGGKKPLTCTTAAATCVIPGLVHKVLYTITITAKSVIGTSPATPTLRVRTT